MNKWCRRSFFVVCVLVWHVMAGIWHFYDAFVPPSKKAGDVALKRVNFGGIRV